MKKKKNKKNTGNVRWPTYLIILIIVIAIIVAAIGLFFKYGPLSKNAPEVLKYSDNWPTANQNLSNTRSSDDSSISLSNVAQLGKAWSSPIKGISDWGAATTNPLILGDTAYFQDLKSNIYAVNVKTGQQLWMKDYSLDTIGPTGVAVGYNKLFAVKGHYEVVALDLNGNELWSNKLSGNTNMGIDIQPVVYNNMVFVSTVPGVSNSNFYKGGSIGIIYALDQKTGKIIWDFDTVDSKDIWGNAQVNSGGGAWYPPAIDPKSGLMFWGIGNAAPWPGTAEFPNASSRPGPNLYTSSMVALNTNDGKLVWYNQVSPHDLFDYDFQVSPILATAMINGAKKDIVIGAGKMGKVVAFDRITGKTLWSTKVGLHKNDELKTLPDGETEVAPSPLGGVETNMAYADGMVYVPVVDLAVKYTPSEFVSDSFNISAAKGDLVAIDVNTGSIKWQQKFDSLNVGAATVVNDLVFTATYDGKIYVFNAKTGTKVWEYTASGGINGWPAVSGDTIIFPVGLGKTPELLGLKIGGTLQIPSTTNVPAGTSGKQFQQ